MSKRKSPQRKTPSEPVVLPPLRSSRLSRAFGWMIILGLAGGIAAANFWGPSATNLVAAPEQNVLLITIDTLRADALGSYGGRAATPHLDRLAREGLRFTFAHAHAVMTLPSHTSILTGRYPFDHGVRDNAGFRLADSATTLAEVAKASGFATGAFVGAFPLDRQFGLAQGFDTYDDVSGREVAPSDFAFSERPATEVVAAAQAWIQRQKTQWFTWVHVFDPHSPYAPAAPFAQQYGADAYAGEVAATDAALGPLLDAIRGSERQTLVIVTADHGEGLGDHGEATHGVFAYESTLRVPLIVAQVGRDVRPGRGAAIDAPVRHVDIFPTIATLADLNAPDGLPGRPLQDAGADNDGERDSYFEAMTAMLKRGWAPLSGVIAGREKYIDLPLDELYDLAADPGELKNLVGASPDQLRRVTARLNAFSAGLPGAQADENADVRARLQSLGYLSGSAPRKAQYTEEDDPKKLIDVDRLMMSGIELHRSGKSAEAMDAYRQVIARRPEMSLAHRRLAYIQWEAGATADAIATLEQDVARNGATVDTEVRLGTYLSESGSAARAIPMLERATKADPTNTEALNALGIAYARGDRGADALRTFKQILAAQPKDAFALENIATVHLQMGNTAAAQEALTRAVQNNPRSSRAHAGLGVIAMQAGRLEEAITHWKRAVDLDARNFDAMFNLAMELLNAGRGAEARPYVERFVATAPRGLYARDIDRFRQWLGR